MRGCEPPYSLAILGCSLEGGTLPVTTNQFN